MEISVLCCCQNHWGRLLRIVLNNGICLLGWLILMNVGISWLGSGGWRGLGGLAPSGRLELGASDAPCGTGPDHATWVYHELFVRFADYYIVTELFQRNRQRNLFWQMLVLMWMLRINCLMLLCKGRTCWGHLPYHKGPILLLWLIFFVFSDLVIIVRLVIDCLLVHGLEVVRLWLEQSAAFDRLLILIVEVVCYIIICFLERWVMPLGYGDVNPSSITTILRNDYVWIALGLLACLQSADATYVLRYPSRHFLARGARRRPRYFGPFGGVLSSDVLLLLHDWNQIRVEAILLMKCCVLLLVVMVVSNRWTAYVLELVGRLRWRTIALIECHCSLFILDRRSRLFCMEFRCCRAEFGRFETFPLLLVFLTLWACTTIFVLFVETFVALSRRRALNYDRRRWRLVTTSQIINILISRVLLLLIHLVELGGRASLTFIFPFLWRAKQGLQ